MDCEDFEAFSAALSSEGETDAKCYTEYTDYVDLCAHGEGQESAYEQCADELEALDDYYGDDPDLI
jgi:hypothetical protein